MHVLKIDSHLYKSIEGWNNKRNNNEIYKYIGEKRKLKVGY